MADSQILALDVGLKRTGMARAGVHAQLPEALASVPTPEVLVTIKDLAGQGDIEAVVVGLPRNLSGDDTDQTKWVRDWVVGAKAKLDVPFYWQDEALTSVQADSLKSEIKKSADQHSLAAAIILQDFLDAAPAERVVC